MKKLLLTIAFLATGATVFAQAVPLTQDWALRVGVSPLITTHTTTGNPSVAYNSNTDHLYLADRYTKISILKADGTLHTPDTLVTGISWKLDKFAYTKIRVADDHAIYAVNMATNGDAANRALVFYRWASETDATPTRTEFAVTSRYGDSFAVSGAGDNTRIYVSGSGNNKVSVYKVTAGVITFAFDIATLANTTQARGSISVESAGAIWLNTPNNGAGNETRRVNFDSSDGTITSTDVIPGAKIDWNYANTEYFKTATRKFLAVSGAVIGSSPYAANTGVRMQIFEIFADVTLPVSVANVEMFPYASASPGPASQITSSNPNAYGDVAIKANADGTLTFFHVVYGNGLASYSTTAVLPVSLTSFSASLVNGQSTLAWSTASESNNKGFEVLRSIDGKNFTSVGFVASRGQNGNAATALSYSFIDRTAAAGVNYYQLNQIDNDGKSELSKVVVSVNVSLSSDAITVYPNPITTHVIVSTGGLDYKGFKYEIFDGNGKKVLSQKAKSGEQQISVANLAPSVYFLKVSKDNVPQKTVKLIKE